MTILSNQRDLGKGTPDGSVVPARHNEV